MLAITKSLLLLSLCSPRFALRNYSQHLGDIEGVKGSKGARIVKK
jgi:hypothetical protein